jgi:DeoR/GlpR family transcriptional regulator of sugar metabolism
MAARERLSKPDRRQRIVAELRANPTVRISALARAFGVTTETVRRDVDSLSRDGLVSRTYGGAAVASLTHEPSLDERYMALTEERMRIALAAVRHVLPGDVLMIDSGATTGHFVRRLAAATTAEITVITNSVGHAVVLGANPGIRVILCPGSYVARERGVYGPEVAQYLRRYRANTAFLGAGGLTAEGPNDVGSELCWVKRAMIERSQACTLLIDHSKLGNLGLELICPLSEINRVVIDRAPEADYQGIFAAGGPELVIADAELTGLTAIGVQPT